MNIDVNALLAAVAAFLTAAVPLIIMWRREANKLKESFLEAKATYEKKNLEAQASFTEKIESLRFRQDESERQTALQKALIEQIGDIKALRTVQDELKTAVAHVGDETAFHAQSVKENTKIVEKLQNAVIDNTAVTRDIGQFLKGVTEQIKKSGEQMVEKSQAVTENTDEHASEIMGKLTEIETWLDRLEKLLEAQAVSIKHLQESVSNEIKKPSVVTNTINIPEQMSPIPPPTPEVSPVPPVAAQ